MTKPISSEEFFSHIPPSISLEIKNITLFLKTRYGAKCYIVGGAVRDHLMGSVCQDYDIECYGLGQKQFDSAMSELGAEGVGKSFFVYKYRNLDISLPRTEQKIGAGHKGFGVELATEPKEASKRRDFTINALMYDMENEAILDYWGGLHDLESRLLRAVNPETFAEDSLRVLRAMNFAARFGFKIEEASCRLCQEIALDDLPKERLFGEFEKMFKGGYPSYGLYYLFALKIAPKLFGLEISNLDFYRLSRAFMYAKSSFLDSLRPYYFFYIFTSFLGVDRRALLERIAAPKSYFKKIAEVPMLPLVIDGAFVASMARKEGLEHFVGNYHPKVRAIAQKLGLWNAPLKIGITAKELMDQGYEDKALGEELEKYVKAKIRELNENCSEL